MKSFILAVVCVLSITACDSQQGAMSKLAIADKETQDAKVLAAKAETELRLLKEAATKKLRMAEAKKEVAQIARAVVRSSQLTDRAGCRILPVSVTTSPSYVEFGSDMKVLYEPKCRTEVANYRAERKHAARKAVAAAKGHRGKLASR